MVKNEVVEAHPGENATCTQEGAAAAQAHPVKLTCEQCYTKFLNAEQIRQLLQGIPTLEQFCTQLQIQVSPTEYIRSLV